MLICTKKYNVSLDAVDTAPKAIEWYLTRHYLAVLAAYTVSDISPLIELMYETGKHEPDLETLEAFADFYNVDISRMKPQKPLTWGE